MLGRLNELPVHIQDKIRLLCVKQASDVSLQDDYGLYIPPSATLTQYAKSTFDLTGAVNDFIEGDKILMLILGESGSGKSFFGQALIKRKSEMFHPGDRIPLFISLPSLRNPKTNLMYEALGNHGFTKEEVDLLCTTQKFLLIFDAYDEINGFDNLYTTNKLEVWDAKIMITCRPSYLAQDANYKRFFMPFKMQKPLAAAFQELFVAPFVRGQVEQYIAQYLTVKAEDLRNEIMVRDDFSNVWLLPQTYKEWIEKIPGLKELSSQPFLLRITMDVLPEVVVEFQSFQDGEDKYRMTQAKLYDNFVKQWFTRQENKLIGSGESVGRSFQKDCMSYAKNLAKKMHEQNLMVVYYEDNASIDDAFGDGEEPQQDDALKQWAVFFSDETITQDKGSEEKRQNRIRARRACLLKKVGENQWSFIHASLRDYFFTLTIAGPQSRPNLLQLNAPQEPAVQALPAKHRVVGRFCLMNRFERPEAEELLREEGITIVFEPQADRQKVVLGQGNFGKVRIARNLINHRFSCVKKIHGDSYIKESMREAEFQRELTGLPNVMPIWDSQVIKSKKTQQDVLVQFMPLAGFGNGEQLISLLPHIQNNDLKQKFLIHILKSLLKGTKGIHSRRVCHLDMKPSNFMLDCRGTVYIIDFGCAHREYSNKLDALLSGGIGDNHYFSPDRLAYWRKRNLKKLMPSNNYEICDKYDGEKADIWAIGVSLLELLLEDSNFIDGCNNAILWKLQNWNSEFFNSCFGNINGWNNAPENSLLGVLKMLLRVNGTQRLSATDALNCQLFSDPNSQITETELKGLMTELIKLKDNPPKKAELSCDSSDEDHANSKAEYSGANYIGVTSDLYATIDKNYIIPSSGETSPRSPGVEKYSNPAIGGVNNSNNDREDDSSSSGMTKKY